MAKTVREVLVKEMRWRIRKLLAESKLRPEAKAKIKREAEPIIAAVSQRTENAIKKQAKVVGKYAKVGFREAQARVPSKVGQRIFEKFQRPRLEKEIWGKAEDIPFHTYPLRDWDDLRPRQTVANKPPTPQNAAATAKLASKEAAKMLRANRSKAAIIERMRQLGVKPPTYGNVPATAGEAVWGPLAEKIVAKAVSKPPVTPLTIRPSLTSEQQAAIASARGYFERGKIEVAAKILREAGFPETAEQMLLKKGLTESELRKAEEMREARMRTGTVSGFDVQEGSEAFDGFDIEEGSEGFDGIDIREGAEAFGSLRGAGAEAQPFVNW